MSPFLVLLGSRNMHLLWTTWGLAMPFRPSAHWLTNWKSLICSTARLGEVIFIPCSYGIFYLTAKSLLHHRKKIVLITWLLSGKFYIFNMDFRRLQQFHFTVYSITWSLYMNMTISLYDYDHCFFYFFATSWDFTYISFT